jgi:hypothetical protein
VNLPQEIIARFQRAPLKGSLLVTDVSLILVSLLMFSYSSSFSTSPNYSGIMQYHLKEVYAQQSTENPDTLASSSFSSPRPPPPSPSIDNFLTYESSKLGIKIQYPSDRDTREQCCKGGSYGYATFTSPLSSLENGDTVQLNIHVLSSSSGNISLSEKANKFIDSHTKNENIEFNLIESRPVTIGIGNTAWQIEYTHNPLEHFGSGGNATLGGPGYQEEGSPIVHVMKTDMIMGESWYTLEYSSEDESLYFKYLPTAQKMIDSFEIIIPRTTTSSSTTTAIPSPTLPPTGMIPKKQPMQKDLVSLLHQATPLQSTTGGEDSNALS